jgi:surfactin synthase thioesterase subunit
MMNLRKGLQNKAKKVAFGVGMGALLTIPVATMVSSTAGAASTATCYVGCSAPSTGLPTTSGNGGAAPVTAPASAASSTSGGGLAFTGADISELVAISVGALGAGTVLVRFSRRRQTA